MSAPDRAPGKVETIARLFHDTYERLAPDFGYRTREASAKPWEDVPEQNRALMCATVAVVLDAVRGRSRDDTVTLAEALAFIRDESVPTPPEWLRAADAIEARFGAGRAEGEPPPAKDPTQ